MNEKINLLEVRNLYEIEHWTMIKIAKHFGVTRQAIHARLVKANVPIHKNHKSTRELDKEELYDLYINFELLIPEVAKRMNTSIDKVSKELDRLNIKKRSVGHFKRKYPFLYKMKIGEEFIIPVPSVKNPLKNLHQKAERINIKIRTKRISYNQLQIKRVA